MVCHRVLAAARGLVPSQFLPACLFQIALVGTAPVGRARLPGPFHSPPASRYPVALPTAAVAALAATCLRGSAVCPSSQQSDEHSWGTARIGRTAM